MNDETSLTDPQPRAPLSPAEVRMRVFAALVALAAGVVAAVVVIDQLRTALAG